MRKLCCKEPTSRSSKTVYRTKRTPTPTPTPTPTLRPFEIEHSARLPGKDSHITWRNFFFFLYLRLGLVFYSRETNNSTFDQIITQNEKFTVCKKKMDFEIDQSPYYYPIGSHHLAPCEKEKSKQTGNTVWLTSDDDKGGFFFSSFSHSINFNSCYCDNKH